MPRVSWRALFGGLLLLQLMFYLHPYTGIRHDSTLYLGQALLKLEPENFKNDLFFAYGSQANFTVFPDLMASAMRYVDTASAFMGMTVVTLVLFLLASATAVKVLLPSRFWFWSLLALVVLPTGYGFHHIVSYAEPFFTGRSLSEPLILLALAAYVGRKFFPAILIWLVAFSIHPLQSISLLILVWCDLCLKNKRWLGLLILPLGAIALGFWGVPSLAVLVRPFGQEWLDLVKEPNQMVFLASWDRADWISWSTDVLLLALMGWHLEGLARRLSFAMIFSLLLGVAGTFIFADLLEWQLLTGVQLWRVQWLGHWMAMAGVPYLLYREYQRGGWRSIPLWLLVDTVLLGAPANQTAAMSSAVIFLVPLYLMWPYVEKNLGPVFHKALQLALPVALLVVMFRYGLFVHAKYLEGSVSNEYQRPLLMIFSHPIIVSMLVTGLVLLFDRFLKLQPVLLAVILVGGFLTFQQWDQRNDWTRFMESAEGAENPFGVSIEPGAQIYWSDELLAPWLILHRPSYFQGLQQAGVLFSYGTALEANRRERITAPLDLQVNVCRIMNGLNKKDDACVVDLDVVGEVCREAKLDLDYVVLTNSLAVEPLGKWHVGAVDKNKKDVNYYIYACRNLL